MSEQTPDPAPVALSSDGPPVSDADARLSRIEAALAVIAAQQAAGPPPEGFARPGSPPPPPGPNPLARLTTAVEVAQMTGHLPGGGKTRAWLRWPVVREVMLVCRLYFDKRYSPTRAAQLGVPIILILLVLNWAFFYFAFTLPIVAQVLERLVVMVLAVVLFRILANEATRYAAVLEYLAKTGRS
jgi:hypothetical protein